MAYPEEVAPLLPETLPDDFNEWDGESSPASIPGNSAESGEAPKPVGQSDYLDAILASYTDTPSVWRSNDPAPVFVKEQNEFVNWQKTASAAPSPDNSSEWESEYILGKASKLAGQPAGRDASLSPVIDKARDARSASPAAVLTKPQKKNSALTEGLPSHAAQWLEENEVALKPGRLDSAEADGTRKRELTPNEMREADEALYELFSPKNVEVKPEEKKPAKNKKWAIVAAVGVCSILLSFALTLSMGHHGAKAAADQPVQPVQQATATELMVNAPKPSANGPLTQGKSAASADSQPATDNQTADEKDDANSAPAVTDKQTQMMNDQLNAPKMISQDMRKQVAENAPPPPASLGAADAEGLSGNSAMPGVFNGHAQSVEQAPPPKPLVISSGVASGMLIQKSQPTYPPIAKTARVSGTVVLHAIIAKNGAIRDLRVLSGPDMLRESALEAVRNWRYRPYTLNNQPTEVETTISVVFNLGS